MGNQESVLANLNHGMTNQVLESSNLPTLQLRDQLGPAVSQNHFQVVCSSIESSSWKSQLDSSNSHLTGWKVGDGSPQDINDLASLDKAHEAKMTEILDGLRAKYYQDGNAVEAQGERQTGPAADAGDRGINPLINQGLPCPPEGTFPVGFIVGFDEDSPTGILDNSRCDPSATVPLLGPPLPGDPSSSRPPPLYVTQGEGGDTQEFWTPKVGRGIRIILETRR